LLRGGRGGGGGGGGWERGGGGGGGRGGGKRERGRKRKREREREREKERECAKHDMVKRRFRFHNTANKSRKFPPKSGVNKRIMSLAYALVIRERETSAYVSIRSGDTSACVRTHDEMVRRGLLRRTGKRHRSSWFLRVSYICRFLLDFINKVAMLHTTSTLCACRCVVSKPCTHTHI